MPGNPWHRLTQTRPGYHTDDAIHFRLPGLVTSACGRRITPTMEEWNATTLITEITCATCNRAIGRGPRAFSSNGHQAQPLAKTRGHPRRDLAVALDNQGLTISEIAERMAISYETASATLYFARMKGNAFRPITERDVDAMQAEIRRRRNHDHSE